MARLKRQYGRDRRLPRELAHINERLFFVDNAPFVGRKGGDVGEIYRQALCFVIPLSMR